MSHTFIFHFFMRVTWGARRNTKAHDNALFTIKNIERNVCNADKA